MYTMSREKYTRSLTLTRRTAGMTETRGIFKRQTKSQRSKKMQQAEAAPCYMSKEGPEELKFGVYFS